MMIGCDRMYQEDEHNSYGIASRKFHCRDCNANFLSLGSKVVEHCCVCNSANIESVNDVFEKKPFIVPFKKSLEDAKNDYRSKVLFHPLVPFVFKSKATIESIHKVYLPVFVVDAIVEGNIDFLAGDKTNIMKEKVQFVETKKYSVLQKVRLNYRNIILNLTSKIQDKLFHTVCDYQFDSILDFEPSLLEDSAVLVADKDIKEVAESGRNRVMKHSLNIAKSNIQHALKKLNANEASVNFSNSKEVLVPAYLLLVRYKDKEYVYLMNGESGVVSSEFVFGMTEIILFSLAMFGLIFLIAFLIAYYL